MAILIATLQITTITMIMKTLMTMVSSVDENRFVIIVRLLPRSNVDEQAKAEKKQSSLRLRVIIVAVMAIILRLLKHLKMNPVVQSSPSFLSFLHVNRVHQSARSSNA